MRAFGKAGNAVIEHGNSNYSTTYSKAKKSAKGFRKLTSFFKSKPVPTPAAPVAPSTPHNSATAEPAASTTVDSAKTVQFDPELPEPELAEPGFRGLPVELDEADSGALPDISDAPAIFESLSQPIAADPLGWTGSTGWPKRKISTLS